MESAQEAATALKFNKTIVQMARTIISGMKQAGIQHYNGAHLRCGRLHWLGCAHAWRAVPAAAAAAAGSLQLW